MSHAHSFVPALGFDWLTRFYDPVIALLMRERPFKQRLIDQARIAPGHDVLDLGCGTGTLVIMIKRACPAARVVGIDIDPKVLAIARRKIRAAGLDIELVEGAVDAPPFPLQSFDRVLSTLVLHHLTADEKRRAAAAARHVLRAGGELHVADWGKPHTPLMRLAAHAVRAFDGSDRLAVHLDGRLPGLIAEAGFSDTAELGRVATPFGTLAFLRATTTA